MGKVRVVLAIASLLAFACAGFCSVSVTPSTAADPLAPVKGVVVDVRGKPIRNARVYVLLYLPYAEKPTFQKLMADGSGRFTYKPKADPNLVSYGLVAAADGYACREVSFPEDGEKREVKIILGPSHTLKGKVVDENGKPVPGANVELSYCFGYSPNSDMDGMYTATNVAGLMEDVTRKDGTFRIQRAPDLSAYDRCFASLRASKKGRATVEKSLTLREPKKDLVRGVTVQQPAECVIEGVLQLPGKTGPAPAGTRVAALVLSSDGYYPRIARTDSSGRFCVSALPPGRVVVALAPPESVIGKDGKQVAGAEPPWVLRAVTQTLKPKQKVKLDLVAETGAIVKGRVVKKNGEPAGGAELSLIDASSPSTPYGEAWREITASDNGEFTVRVASGEARIEFENYADGSAAYNTKGEVELTVANGDEKTGVELVVEESPDADIDYHKATKDIPKDFELKPGTYELTWDPEKDCAEAMDADDDMDAAQIKPKVKGNPQFRSAKPRYFAFRFDGPDQSGHLLMALDESKGTGKGYDTAYVDVNRNWDLSDDQPVKFRIDDDYDDVSLSEFAVPLRQRAPDGTVTERMVTARANIRSYGGYQTASVARKGAWKGSIDSSKGKVECVVTDTNCSGACGEAPEYDSKGEIKHKGDSIYIDTNGARGAILYCYGAHRIDLYRIAMIANRFYAITVSSPGDKVTVEPCTSAMGTLLVRGSGINGLRANATGVSVAGEPGSYDLEAIAGKAPSLPAGRYYIRACSLQVKSAKAPLLRLDCELSRPVEVKPGTQTVLDISGKIAASINPEEKTLVWTPGESADIDWDLELGNGVTIASIGSQTNSNRPKVQFINSRGKLVHTTTAGYT